jgi:hypothetical protein
MGLLVPNFGKGEGIGECGGIRSKLYFFFFLRFLCSVHHFVLPNEVNNPGRNFQI